MHLDVARTLAEEVALPPCTCLGLSCSVNMSGIPVAARTIRCGSHPPTEALWACPVFHNERLGDGVEEIELDPAHCNEESLF